MISFVNVDQRIHLHVYQACIAQHTGYAPADVQIDSMSFGVGNKSFFKLVPSWKRRVADFQSASCRATTPSLLTNAAISGGTKKIHFFGQVTHDLITLHNESGGKQGQTMSFRRDQFR